MPLSREDLAALIQASIAKQTGGPAIGDAPVNPNGRMLPPRNPNDLQIAPPKPDPEAAANAQIQRAVNRPPQPSAMDVINRAMPKVPGGPVGQNLDEMEEQNELKNSMDEAKLKAAYYRNLANPVK